MLNLAQKAWRRRKSLMPVQALTFDRPMIIFQSDDWGRVGVRDQEGFNALKASGLSLGSEPYDYYTLETADDVQDICQTLLRHRDSIGRPPPLVMNFIGANVDFDRTVAAGFEHIHLCTLKNGLPGTWSRPGLLPAYWAGVEAGVFYPALHGLTHFCRSAVEQALRTDDERGHVLRTLYSAETPYIYHLMPWVGYEYWDSSKASSPVFLSLQEQKSLVREAVDEFQRLFGVAPMSACAPGYRSNEDTQAAWGEMGVRVVQGGSDIATPPYVNGCGLLQLQRNVDLEPALDPLRYSVGSALRQSARAFKRGIPAIVSIHSINFHSSLRDFRSLTLRMLDQFLSALEKEYPNLLYLHDADLYEVVNEGGYRFNDTKVTVSTQRRWILAPEFFRQESGQIVEQTQSVSMR